MRRLTLYTILFALCLAYSCTTKTKINPEITHDELYAHVDFLASDSLMGRQPGTPYDRVVAKYIKDVMSESGLELLSRNGFQFIEFIDHQDIGYNNFFSVNEKHFTLRKDFMVLPFSSSDTLVSSAVFAGYGISYVSDTLVWDDYGTINVTDKWVILLRGNPLGDDSSSPLANFGADRYKAMVAKDMGAAGVILVSGNKFDKQDQLQISKQKNFSIDIPVVQVKREVADFILRQTGRTVAELEQRLIESHQPNSFLVSSNVCARTSIITNKMSSQNVVAHIEGSDPILKHQYIVIGAHYDHIGMGGKNSSSRMPDTLAVHNGADDNASGVAAVLEIAQKLATVTPKRSVLVVAFAAEEQGLLGSRYFVENPIVPNDSIVAMVNIDMLGRLNDEMGLQIGGVGTSTEYEGILTQLNDNYGFKLALSQQGYGPSDHASFYAYNIPVLFFTTGAHTDYHTPNDDISRLNMQGLAQASNYIYDVVKRIADNPNRLVFQEAGPSKPTSRHGQELKVKLGIMPDVSGATNDGLRILAVSENQPAHVAGLQKNDVITAIDGKPVKNIQDYMFRLQELTPGTTVSLEYTRDGVVNVVLVLL
jgi:hypothetical protein